MGLFGIINVYLNFAFLVRTNYNYGWIVSFFLNLFKIHLLQFVPLLNEAGKVLPIKLYRINANMN